MDEKTGQELISVLKKLGSIISENESDYCNSQQAHSILGLGSLQQLKWLTEKGFLMRYPRGNGFRYKKSECRSIAQLIDQGEIKLPTFGNTPKK